MIQYHKLYLCQVAASCILILFFLSHQSFADVPPPVGSPVSSPVAPISSSNACRYTPDPSFCKSVLPNNNSSANVYDYGRYSVRKSLSAARKFLSLIEKYLRHSKDLTITAVRALQDCKFLAECNMDFLLDSFKVVNGTSKILPTLEAEDVQTLLSAILTNTQTCLDGLQATASTWSVRNGLIAPLANDTRLFSVSLALFRAWVPKKKKIPSHPTRKQLPVGNGTLPLKMSEQHRAFFESVSRRNLLQTTDDGEDQVMINDIVIVSQDGSGNFTTINDAVAVAPNNTDGSTGYFLIYITAGVYAEYVTISKNQKYSRIRTLDFSVVGQGFVAVNITFRNTAGAIKHQAVAVRNGADLSTFYSCSFEGYQDTLYAHSLRQFYRDCDIYGTVDFIFGNAAAVFQNCNMYPRLPLNFQFNVITAQGRTDPNQNTGISIQNCTVRAADDLASSNSSVETYLGRPWKQYSRTVYMYSFLDSIINPLGWHEWIGDFALNTSYYAEFSNTGPGSNKSGRVTWPGFYIINATDAANFTVSNFLLGDGWVWQTGVPYTSGLLS
ncbi:unnamed protein product [Coffea canephora]|uniref:Pectinesterase n=1 Tax=Coffea canephora TaxID=49390 RepID=A0A068VBG7_COFCA|nr:unnamed protein product [Coffea canephora]